MSRARLRCVFGLLAGALAVACSPKATTDDRPLLARVGDVPIYLDEFEKELSRIRLWDPLESTCRHASLSIL